MSSHELQEATLRKVVITGGPSSGKTTVLNHLKATLPEEITYCEEAAMAVASAGFPIPDVTDWSYEWQLSFQDAVYRTQLSLESVAIQQALSCGSKLIIFDRGILDGAAYFNEDLPEFADRYSVDPKELASTYDKVIMLDSIANYGESYFRKYVHVEKFHDFEQSIGFEKKTRRIWATHDDLVEVYSENINEKIEQVLRIVRDLLASNS